MLPNQLVREQASVALSGSGIKAVTARRDTIIPSGEPTFLGCVIGKRRRTFSESRTSVHVLIIS